MDAVGSLALLPCTWGLQQHRSRIQEERSRQVRCHCQSRAFSANAKDITRHVLQGGVAYLVVMHRVALEHPIPLPPRQTKIPQLGEEPMHMSNNSITHIWTNPWAAIVCPSAILPQLDFELFSIIIKKNVGPVKHFGGLSFAT